MYFGYYCWVSLPIRKVCNIYINNVSVQEVVYSPDPNTNHSDADSQSHSAILLAETKA